MPRLKDNLLKKSTEFSESSVNKLTAAEGGRFTHTVHKVIFNQDQHEYFRKQALSRLAHSIEAMAGAFIQMILPEQPKTLSSRDIMGNMIYSELMPNYQSLESKTRNEILEDIKQGKTKGFGEVMAISYFLNEVDSKYGNLGISTVNNEQRVIKIDSDWCLANIRDYGFIGDDYHTNQITPKGIEQLPLMNDYKTFNLLDRVSHGQDNPAYLASSIANKDFEPEFSNQPQFRNEVNQTFLKILMTPPEIIERMALITATSKTNEGGIANEIQIRQQQLFFSLTQNHSFKKYLNTAEAQKLIEKTQKRLVEYAKDMGIEEKDLPSLEDQKSRLELININLSPKLAQHLGNINNLTPQIMQAAHRSYFDHFELLLLALKLAEKAKTDAIIEGEEASLNFIENLIDYIKRDSAKIFARCLQDSLNKTLINQNGESMHAFFNEAEKRLPQIILLARKADVINESYYPKIEENINKSKTLSSHQAALNQIDTLYANHKMSEIDGKLSTAPTNPFDHIDLLFKKIDTLKAAIGIVQNPIYKREYSYCHHLINNETLANVKNLIPSLINHAAQLCTTIETEGYRLFQSGKELESLNYKANKLLELNTKLGKIISNLTSHQIDTKHLVDTFGKIEGNLILQCHVRDIYHLNEKINNLDESDSSTKTIYKRLELLKEKLILDEKCIPIMVDLGFDNHNNFFVLDKNATLHEIESRLNDFVTTIKNETIKNSTNLEKCLNLKVELLQFYNKCNKAVSDLGPEQVLFDKLAIKSLTNEIRHDTNAILTATEKTTKDKSLGERELAKYYSNRITKIESLIKIIDSTDIKDLKIKLKQALDNTKQQLLHLKDSREESVTLSLFNNSIEKLNQYKKDGDHEKFANESLTAISHAETLANLYKKMENYDKVNLMNNKIYHLQDGRNKAIAQAITNSFKPMR